MINIMNMRKRNIMPMKEATQRKLLTPDEYARHLKDRCGLTETETRMVLANVYKRIEKDFKK